LWEEQLALIRWFVGVGVILAAMPGGSSTVILASKYGRDTTYASKLVIVSTILSLISIPLWGMLL
jgi:predicted permease